MVVFEVVGVIVFGIAAGPEAFVGVRAEWVRALEQQPENYRDLLRSGLS